MDASLGVPMLESVSQSGRGWPVGPHSSSEKNGAGRAAVYLPVHNLGNV